VDGRLLKIVVIWVEIVRLGMMLFVRPSAHSSNRDWVVSMGAEDEGGIMIVGGLEATAVAGRGCQWNGSFLNCCCLFYFAHSHLFSAGCSSNRAFYVSLHIIHLYPTHNIVHSIIFTCITLFQSSPCVISTCILSRIYLPTREGRYNWEG
jgi:hypothetical protein